jgi:hypothetical protein
VAGIDAKLSCKETAASHVLDYHVQGTQHAELQTCSRVSTFLCFVTFKYRFF